MSYNTDTINHNKSTRSLNGPVVYILLSILFKFTFVSHTLSLSLVLSVTVFPHTEAVCRVCIEGAASEALHSKESCAVQVLVRDQLYSFWVHHVCPDPPQHCHPGRTGNELDTFWIVMRRTKAITVHQCTLPDFCPVISFVRLFTTLVITTFKSVTAVLFLGRGICSSSGLSQKSNRDLYYHRTAFM